MSSFYNSDKEVRKWPKRREYLPIKSIDADYSGILSAILRFARLLSGGRQAVKIIAQTLAYSFCERSYRKTLISRFVRKNYIIKIN